MNSAIKAAEEQLLQVLGTNLAAEKSVFIGNQSTGETVVPGSNGTQVYVYSSGGESGGVNIISASGIPKAKLNYGQPILIKKTPGGAYAFSRIDADVDEIYTQGLSEAPTQEPVLVSQIRWGTIHPVSASLAVLVVGAWYGDTYVGDLVSAAFDGTAQDTGASSITVPTTNNRQVAVLIQMDATNGVLEYKQSSAYSAAISPIAAYSAGLLPTLDSGRYRVGFVFLKKGATALTYGDLWQAPELLSKGSGGSEWGVIQSTDRTLSANTQIVLDELTVASGTTVTIESGALMKII